MDTLKFTKCKIANGLDVANDNANYFIMITNSGLMTY